MLGEQLCKSFDKRQDNKAENAQYITQKANELKAYENSCHRAINDAKKDYEKKVNEFEKLRMKEERWLLKNGKVPLFFTNPSSNSIKGEIVRSICADDEGIIWFCTEDGWLNRLDPQTRIVKNFEIVKKLNMHEIVMDNERLWVCSYGKGVYIFDIKKERTIRHYDLPSNTTTTGLKTKDGNIYIGTIAGLYRYEPDSFPI